MKERCTKPILEPELCYNQSASKANLLRRIKKTQPSSSLISSNQWEIFLPQARGIATSLQSPHILITAVSHPGSFTVFTLALLLLWLLSPLCFKPEDAQYFSASAETDSNQEFLPFDDSTEVLITFSRDTYTFKILLARAWGWDFWESSALRNNHYQHHHPV